MAWLLARGARWAAVLPLVAWLPGPVPQLLPVVALGLLCARAPRECWAPPALLARAGARLPVARSAG